MSILKVDGRSIHCGSGSHATNIFNGHFSYSRFVWAVNQLHSKNGVTAVLLIRLRATHCESFLVSFSCFSVFVTGSQWICRVHHVLLVVPRRQFGCLRRRCRWCYELLAGISGAQLGLIWSSPSAALHVFHEELSTGTFFAGVYTLFRLSVQPYARNWKRIIEDRRTIRGVIVVPSAL